MDVTYTLAPRIDDTLSVTRDVQRLTFMDYEVTYNKFWGCYLTYKGRVYEGSAFIFIDLNQDNVVQLLTCNEKTLQELALLWTDKCR